MMLLLDEEDLEENFFLYGIKISSLEEYRFIYLLNRSLNLKFQRISDLDVTINKIRNYYSTYYYYDETSLNDCHIIKNTSHLDKRSHNEYLLFDEIDEQHYLLERFKFYDFFLKVNGNLIIKPSFTLSLQRLDFIRKINQIELNKKEQRFLII